MPAGIPGPWTPGEKSNRGLRRSRVSRLPCDLLVSTCASSPWRPGRARPRAWTATGSARRSANGREARPTLGRGTRSGPSWRAGPIRTATRMTADVTDAAYPEWTFSGEAENHHYLVPAVLRSLPHQRGLRLLDIGCGNGALSARLAE